MSNKKEVNKFFYENLSMYPHLRKIRDNLWSKDGKSRVSVMIGAGFSRNASKIEENFSGMTLWDGLKKIMTENLSNNMDILDKDVLEIGQIYEDEYGRASLDDLLKEAIPDDNYEPDILHFNLLNLPWADIYTTNYDTLLERAKRNVHERNYQVVYDVNDIPNSTSPRIIKLHGSFPSNRPFIFTKSDYKNYPKRFNPFVNMVQQSIMETTFLLIGFSGDDPNFEKWTSWVRENLGDQMPKIYMIGYDQKSNKENLKAKGITLIDFKELYLTEKDPYKEMFKDLFEFLAYKNREEKTQWPFRPYKRFNLSIDDLRYNRESFPGWIVMPDEIRHSNANIIRYFAIEKINSVSTLKDKQELEFINELLWCYDYFYIPLETDIQKKLEYLIEEIIEDIDSNLISVLLALLKKSRLDCNKDKFNKYKTLLEKVNLDRSQQHKLIFEEILFNFALNNINSVEAQLDVWNIGKKEIEWGIKKAGILINLSRISEAKEILEEYLQMIRGLLSIQGDDYRILSFESVALNLLRRINNNFEYGFDRLRSLNLKNCNSDTEFNHSLISVKKYEYTLGTKITPGFDPGKRTISSKMGDYFTTDLLDSYAVLHIHETLNLNIREDLQYELALKNLEILYPLYSLIRRIHFIKLKKVDEIFSREYVYKLKEDSLKILIEIIKNALAQEAQSIINVDIVLEILSRIYFVLPNNMKLEQDINIINLINKNSFLKFNRKNILLKLLERITFDKNSSEQTEFCERLFESNIHSNLKSDGSFEVHDFFDPFLVTFEISSKISNLKISESKILELLGYLNESLDPSIKEAALIRLTFLEVTGSLSLIYRKKFIEILKELPNDKQQGRSNFLFDSVLDKIINSSSDLSEEMVETLLSKKIPAFYSKGVFADTFSIGDYFNELCGVFPSIIEKKVKKIPKVDLMRNWLKKFFEWWDSQEEGLLIDQHIDFHINDYLERAVFFIKNNFLGVIPTDFLYKEEISKLKNIFEKIDANRPELSIYLIPSFERLQIPINYTLETILDSLKLKEINKVESAGIIFYDYLVFLERGELVIDSNLVKNELFSMMFYGSEDIFRTAVDTLKYCMEYIPTIFVNSECKMLMNFLNNYLQMIENEKVIISTLNDFKIISNASGLVAYLYQNHDIISKEDIIKWKNYIDNHRLPEVRRYRDLLI